MNTDAPYDGLLRLTAGIVAAHVSHNAVAGDALPEVIRAVYAALSTMGATPVPGARQEPAVPTEESVFPDYLVCLEDGKTLKVLKRHLRSAHGMTLEDYRAKWGLPPDYPTVAPASASHRSSVATARGLGRKLQSAAEMEVPVQRIPQRKRGRKLGSQNRQPKQ